jgi:DUF4097 and DUF4098 domain-containing protein YvlB
VRAEIVKLGRILEIPLVLTALFICLSDSAVLAERHTFTFHKELRTGANPTLGVRNTSGEIRIESHPDDKVIIDAFKVVEADDFERAKRIAEEIEVNIRDYDSQIEIKTRHPSRKSRRFFKRFFSPGRNVMVYVDYHILVPEEIELEVHSTSGDVIISDISGGVEVRATSGDLSMKKMRGNLDLETTSGDAEVFDVEGDVAIRGTSSDLEMSDIKGDVEISSTSGETSVEDLTGSVRINKTSGDIYLEMMKGDIQASSSSGDLMIDQIEGGLDLETSSGDIEVKTRILPRCEYHVETSSGSVGFSLPENSDARLTLKTSSGDINTELPLTLHRISRNLLEGELGSGGPEIHLVTSSGDIELREYKR